MAVEYERRFLVPDLTAIPDFSLHSGYELIVQGYFGQHEGETLRVRRRITMHGRTDQLLLESPAVLEYKGARQDDRRVEESWTVPDWIAPRLMRIAPHIVQKRRYNVIVQPGIWDIDVFLGANLGLVIAEYETERPPDRFRPAPWCGLDIGPAREFDNERLAAEPIRDWPAHQLRHYGLTFREHE